MHTVPRVLAALIALLTVAPAAGTQDDPAGLIAVSLQLHVRLGEQASFEQTFKEHLSGHRIQGDPWSWHTWQIITGADLGSYIVRSHGHTWAEFDARDSASRLDATHLLATVGPTLESISSQIEALEPALSNWNVEARRPKLVEITVYRIHPHAVRDFYFALQKVHRAVAGAGLDLEYAWSSVVNGSEGPTMVLGVPHPSWSDFQPLEASVWDIVEDRYGDHEAEQLRAELGRAIQSERSFIARYREDLSYQPATTAEE